MGGSCSLSSSGAVVLSPRSVAPQSGLHSQRPQNRTASTATDDDAISEEGTAPPRVVDVDSAIEARRRLLQTMASHVGPHATNAQHSPSTHPQPQPAQGRQQLVHHPPFPPAAVDRTEVGLPGSTSAVSSDEPGALDASTARRLQHEWLVVGRSNTFSIHSANESSSLAASNAAVFSPYVSPTQNGAANTTAASGSFSVNHHFRTSSSIPPVASASTLQISATQDSHGNASAVVAGTATHGMDGSAAVMGSSAKFGRVRSVSWGLEA